MRRRTPVPARGICSERTCGGWRRTTSCGEGRAHDQVRRVDQRGEAGEVEEPEPELAQDGEACTHKPVTDGHAFLKHVRRNIPVRFQCYDPEALPTDLRKTQCEAGRVRRIEIFLERSVEDQFRQGQGSSCLRVCPGSQPRDNRATPSSPAYRFIALRVAMAITRASFRPMPNAARWPISTFASPPSVSYAIIRKVHNCNIGLSSAPSLWASSHDLFTKLR